MSREDDMLTSAAQFYRLSGLLPNFLSVSVHGENDFKLL